MILSRSLAESDCRLPGLLVLVFFFFFFKKLVLVFNYLSIFSIIGFSKVFCLFNLILLRPPRKSLALLTFNIC